jgi:hypothetical protein
VSFPLEIHFSSSTGKEYKQTIFSSTKAENFCDGQKPLRGLMHLTEIIPSVPLNQVQVELSMRIIYQRRKLKEENEKI